MTWSDIIPPMLIPFLLSIAVQVLALSLRSFWALPLTLSAAYVATHTVMTGFPSFPPITVDGWILFAALVAAPLTLVDRFLPRRRITAPILWTLYAFAFFWLAIGARKGFLFVSLLALATGLAIFLAQSFHSISEDEPTPLISALFTLTSASFATAGILVLGASLRLSFLAMSLGFFALALAIVLGILIALKKRPENLHLENLFPIYFILLAGLFTSGVLFAKAPFAAAVLIALAMVAGLSLRHRSRLLSVVATLVFTAAALGYTYYDLHLATPPPAEDTYDPYSW